MRHEGLLSGMRRHYSDPAHTERMTRNDHEQFCDHRLDKTGEKKRLLQRQSMQVTEYIEHILYIEYIGREHIFLPQEEYIT